MYKSKNFLACFSLCLLFSCNTQTQQKPDLEKAQAGVTLNQNPNVNQEPYDSIPKNTQKAVDMAFLMGKFDPTKSADFEAVGAPWSDKQGMILHKETFASFKKMWEAAKKDGVVLKVISSTRTFDQQKFIWESKWAKYAKDYPDAMVRARKILEFSSMPGTSRHHWGTDIDLNDLNNESFQKGGKLVKVYEWLSQHAHEYGFCQPYTPKGKARPEGYNEEKWHWSYTPLSKPFLEQYLKSVNNGMISGFKGAETASKIKAVENFAGGINTECK